MKRIIALFLSFILTSQMLVMAEQEKLQLRDENDYKKMPNAWHLTAIYLPVYGVVGICNGIRIYKEKKKIRKHNYNVLKQLVNNEQVNPNVENNTIFQDKDNSSIQKVNYNKKSLKNNISDKTLNVESIDIVKTNKLQTSEKNSDLTFIEITHSIKYVFNARPEKNPITIGFYIDSKNKKVFNEDKSEVDYIKEFKDSQISFMTIYYTDNYKVCECYDIDRYTGIVEFCLFKHPINLKGKINSAYIDIKDGFVASGKGTAKRIDVSQQKF